MQQPCFNFSVTDVDDQILAYLLPGRENAKQSKWLAAQLGISDVRVRNSIRRLIMERDLLIGSATTAPAGFFLAARQEELAEASRGLYGRALSILARSAKLRKQSLRMVFLQACGPRNRSGRCRYEGGSQKTFR